MERATRNMERRPRAVFPASSIWPPASNIYDLAKGPVTRSYNKVRVDRAEATANLDADKHGIKAFRATSESLDPFRRVPTLGLTYLPEIVTPVEQIQGMIAVPKSILSRDISLIFWNSSSRFPAIMVSVTGYFISPFSM